MRKRMGSDSVWFPTELTPGKYVARHPLSFKKRGGEGGEFEVNNPQHVSLNSKLRHYQRFGILMRGTDLRVVR